MNRPSSGAKAALMPGGLVSQLSLSTGVFRFTSLIPKIRICWDLRSGEVVGRRRLRESGQARLSPVKSSVLCNPTPPPLPHSHFEQR